MSTEILLVIDPSQKLPLTRLQTLWEWRNRVLLEEHYVFNEAIPPEEEFGTNRRRALDKTTATTSREISILLPRVFGGGSLEPFPFPDSRDHLSEPPGPFSFPDSTFYFLYFLLSLALLSLVQIPDFLQYDGLRAPWEWT